MPQHYRSGLDWHFITFWGALGVAIVLMAAQGVRQDHRIPPIWTAEGQVEVRELSTKLIGWPGLPGRPAGNQPVPLISPLSWPRSR